MNQYGGVQNVQGGDHAMNAPLLPLDLNKEDIERLTQLSPTARQLEIDEKV